MTKPPTVLLVDDETSFRENLAFFLEGKGFRVVQAECGEEALRIAREVALDLAVLDVLMPGMDGIRLMGELRALGRPVQVILVTGDLSPETSARARKGGAHACLSKPIPLREVERALRDAMGALEGGPPSHP